MSNWWLFHPEISGAMGPTCKWSRVPSCREGASGKGGSQELAPRKKPPTRKFTNVDSTLRKGLPSNHDFSEESCYFSGKTPLDQGLI